MRQTIPWALAAVFAVFFLVCGCAENASDRNAGEGAGGQDGAQQQTAAPGAADAASRREPITILCGTSFRPPMEELTEMYQQETGRTTELSFGGSEDHLPNVKAKVAGDVYVTHSPYQQYTREADALLREVQVGFLAPVLVVQEGNPKGIDKIEDLAEPGLQVILTNPEFSTCGEMTFALLEKKGIQDAVLKNVGNAMFKHHSEVGNKMQLGLGDAAIMWNGVANNFLDSIDVVPVPYEYDQEIVVSVMGLTYTDQPGQVQQFLDFVEAHGEAVFEQHGYVK